MIKYYPIICTIILLGAERQNIKGTVTALEEFIIMADVSWKAENKY